MITKLEAGQVTEFRDTLRGAALGTGHPTQAEMEKQVIKAQHEISQERDIVQCHFIINNMNQSHELEALKAKTLVVHCENDNFFDLSIAQGLQKRIPDSKLTLINHCGHLPMVEQPEATSALMRLWLSL